MLKDLVISAEAIKVQENDYSVRKLTGLVEELRELNETGKLRYHDSRKNKGVANVLDKMSEIILERFGMSIRILGDNDGPAIFTPLAPVINAHSIDSMDSIKQQTSFIKKVVGNLGEINPSEIDTFNDAWKEVMADLNASSREFLKASNYGNLKVDNDKVFITGAEKITYFMMVPWRSLFEKSYTDREILAMVYHELGHAYNVLAYSNHLAPTLVSISDAMTAGTKNDEDSLIVPGILEINPKSDDSIEIQLRESLFNDNSLLKMSMVNNEMTADQFSVRFGFAKELSGVLSHYSYPVGLLEVLDDISLAITLSFLGLVIMTYLTPQLLILGLYLMSMFIAGITIKSLYEFIYPKETAAIGQIYDEPYERINKIAKDLRRQLRTSNLSESYKNDIVLTLDGINKIMEKLDNTPNLLNSLYLYTVKGDDTSVVNFNRLVEDIMESPLYGDKQKLVKLLG